MHQVRLYNTVHVREEYLVLENTFSALFAWRAETYMFALIEAQKHWGGVIQCKFLRNSSATCHAVALLGTM